MKSTEQKEVIHIESVKIKIKNFNKSKRLGSSTLIFFSFFSSLIVSSDFGPPKLHHMHSTSYLLSEESRSWGFYGSFMPNKRTFFLSA